MRSGTSKRERKRQHTLEKRMDKRDVVFSDLLYTKRD